ncbi:MAG TPA: hypothetical protein PKK06_13775 [Phycisphaerae bacterium]|nr:hypothetical protein [Phycisphaerae bacterium]HNU46284.1 hypothetical protein [Phycisphaerae bacterium]
MIRYECDKCGAPLHANDPRRFIVKIEVYAAAGHIELDPEQTVDADAALKEVIEQLARANPDEVEDQTYRCLRFDLCDACRRQLLARPLG